MSMIQRMNAAKNLCNVDPKILIKVNCSMTTHLLVLSCNPAILNSRSLRSADAFPVVASLPAKNHSSPNFCFLCACPTFGS